MQGRTAWYANTFRDIQEIEAILLNDIATQPASLPPLTKTQMAQLKGKLNAILDTVESARKLWIKLRA